MGTRPTARVRGSKISMLRRRSGRVRWCAWCPGNLQISWCLMAPSGFQFGPLAPLCRLHFRLSANVELAGYCLSRGVRAAAGLSWGMRAAANLAESWARLPLPCPLGCAATGWQDAAGMANFHAGPLPFSPPSMRCTMLAIQPLGSMCTPPLPEVSEACACARSVRVSSLQQQARSEECR